MKRPPIYSTNRFAPQARRGALSLLEVAIALAIFVVGALALLRIFPPGLTVIEDSSKRLIGSRMANNLLARFDAAPDAIPDAIYDAQFNGGWGWNDFPGAMLPVRSRGLSLPRSPDNVDDSALGHLRFVRGEGQQLQGPFPSDGGLVRVLSSFVVDRARADVYREGAVENVKIGADGELDFAGALYKQTNRGDRPISTFSGVATGQGVGFHEPIIDLQNADQAVQLKEPDPSSDPSAVVANPTYTLTLQLQDLAGVTDRSAFYGGYVNQHKPQVSFSISAPLINGALPGNGSLPTDDFKINLSGGQTFVPGTKYPLLFDSNGRAAISVTVFDDALPESNEYFYIYLSGALGCSVRQQRFLCCIPANDGAPAATVTDPTLAPPLLAVRPPLDLRFNAARPVIYQASYNWNGGGARNEPLTFPADDAGYPQAVDAWPSSSGVRPGRVDRAYWNNTSADPQIAPSAISLKFRQFLGTAPVENGTSVTLTGLRVPDIYAPNAPANRDYPVEQLNKVSIDYNVYDWRYLTESVSQFATPFPGSKQDYPLVLGPLLGFSDTSDLREVRLPVGGLLGPVYTINVFQQSGNLPSFSTRTLDYRTVSDAAQRQALKDLFKQGRLLTSIRDSGPNAQFEFKAYYRTADGWAQQIGATAARYLPWRDPAQYGPWSALRAQISEPWREFVSADGRLYFHPSEAGKTVSIQNALGQPYSEMAIDDRIIARPASVPAAFAPSGKVAVSSGTVAAPIYDVAAPDVADPNMDAATQTRGRAGLQGRSAWTNAEVYQQQFAP